MINTDIPISEGFLLPNGNRLVPRLPPKFTHLRFSQVQQIELSLRLYAEGNHIIVAQWPCGFGKCQPNSEPVLTPSGWVAMGDLEVGDTVYDQDGRETLVVGVFDQGEKEIFRVTFNDGSSTRACGDHLWSVVRQDHKARQDDAERNWKTMTTSELSSRLLTKGRGGCLWRIPVVKPIQMSEAELPIDPYLLGLLIGNGSLRQGCIGFSSNDEELAKYVSDNLPGDVELFHYINPNKPERTWDYRITKGDRVGPKVHILMSKLIEVGLRGMGASEKFVPNDYKFSSIIQRLAILQGVLDTDGHAIPRGGVEYCTASFRLGEDMAYLVQSLGGIARRGNVKVVVDSKGVPRDYFRWNFKLTKDFPPFRLGRKLSDWKPPTLYPPTRLMSDIATCGTEKCRCISVSSAKKTYVTNDCIVTHNSVAAECIRQGLASLFENSLRMAYVPPYIYLENQFLGDFTHADVLHGRSNFPHPLDPTAYPRETCSDCVKVPDSAGELVRSHCHDRVCAYRDAKANFMSAETGVVNLTYYLTAKNYLRIFNPWGPEPTDTRVVGLRNRISGQCVTDNLNQFLEIRSLVGAGVDPLTCQICHQKPDWIGIWHDGSDYLLRCQSHAPENSTPSYWSKEIEGKPDRGWGKRFFTVIDEADVLAENLKKFIGVEISMQRVFRMAERVNWDVNLPPTHNMALNWPEWLEWMRCLTMECLKQAGPMRAGQIAENRYRNGLTDLSQSINRVESNWVYQPHRSMKQDTGTRTGATEKVTFLPIRVGEYGVEKFINGIGLGLFMSGSIGPHKVFANNIGLDKSNHKYAFISHERDWHRWRGPIFRFSDIKVVKEDQKLPWKLQPCWSKLVAACVWICIKFPDDRKIFHTVSHDLTRELGYRVKEVLGARIIVHDITQPGDDNTIKQAAIDQYFSTHGGCIFSPSLTRGFDCPGDKCRDSVMVKVPFVSMADKQVKARMAEDDGQLWYRCEAVNECTQLFDRNQRSASDWGRKWVIDECFDQLVTLTALFPKYVLNSVRAKGDFNQNDLLRAIGENVPVPVLPPLRGRR